MKRGCCCRRRCQHELVPTSKHCSAGRCFWLAQIHDSCIATAGERNPHVHHTLHARAREVYEILLIWNLSRGRRPGEVSENLYQVKTLPLTESIAALNHLSFVHCASGVMAKGKSKNGGMRHSHLHARINFLHEAATYLTVPQHRVTSSIARPTREAVQKASDASSEDHVKVGIGKPLHTQLKPLSEQGCQQEQGPKLAQRLSIGMPDNSTCSSGLTSSAGLQFHLSRHMRQVAQRATIRVPSSLKHTICKRCGAILIPNETSSKQVENRSRGGKKPWADVLLVECRLCGAAKRFPVGARRQAKKVDRVTNTRENGTEGVLHATQRTGSKQTVPIAKP